MASDTLPVTSASSRDETLRLLLLDERRRLLETTRVRMDDVREGGHDAQEVRDEAEVFEADIRADLELALLAMQHETLAKIDAALAELDEGTYGRCADCGAEIATRRLQALPFALRCRTCQDRFELAEELQPVAPDHLWPRRWSAHAA